MAFEFSELSYEEKARIAGGLRPPKQPLLARALGIDVYFTLLKRFLEDRPDTEDHDDFDNYFWHTNRTALKQRGYGSCDCIPCILKASGVNPEDARGVPVTVRKRAEWIA